MKASVRIGNGAGFWGDNLDAPVRLVEKGNLDYLTLEYLAELTLSMLAHKRRREPQAGFIPDFPKLCERLAPFLLRQPGLRIVTNAGGLNPQGCAREVARSLKAAGLGDIKVGWVTGDDLLASAPKWLSEGERFLHFDTGKSLENFQRDVVSANAYLGAASICAALDLGARIVVTGRVADASLTVGPAMHEFGWAWDDWARLAGASVAGHLIECGAQVTGGLLSRWRTVRDYANIGYPIAEIFEDGGCRITKPAGTGGVVNRETVTEQLLYEIGDPAHYLTPDVDVDFTGLEVEEIGPDVVGVSGARGNPPPATLKVSCAYTDGFTARGDLVVCGHDAVEKARVSGDILLDRVRLAGRKLEGQSVEILGLGACLPGTTIAAAELKEVVLRVSVRDPDRELVERFCREFSPLITSGPPGITGYAGSRPQPRQVFAFWPTTVARSRVHPRVEVHPAGEVAE